MQRVFEDSPESSYYKRKKNLKYKPMVKLLLQEKTDAR